MVSLGVLPLANRLLTAEQLHEPEPGYPLDVVFCPECSLVQITETVSPEVLFREYVYFSSYSETMLRHAEEIADRLVKSRRLSSESLVVEVASNDGYLLQFYKKRGIPVLGIEPALNVAEIAEARGIPTIKDFFGTSVAARLRDEGKRAEVLHAHNVLAHVADLSGVLTGMTMLLQDDGVAVIEVPYVRDLIEHVEFDTIYHEHLCYFSLTSLSRIFERQGLRVVAVEKIPVHGGSLRLFARRGGPRPSAEVSRMLEDERVLGMAGFEFYRDFGARIERLRAELLTCLRRLKAEGRRIAAYGASAKGSVLLNYLQVGRETLEFVVDRNPVKQGRYMPGARLLIYPPERLLESAPDYVLVLVWNVLDEVLTQQDEFRRRGGRFIVPLPEVRII